MKFSSASAHQFTIGSLFILLISLICFGLVAAPSSAEPTNWSSSLPSPLPPQPAQLVKHVTPPATTAQHISSNSSNNNNLHQELSNQYISPLVAATQLAKERQPNIKRPTRSLENVVSSFKLPRLAQASQQQSTSSSSSSVENDQSQSGAGGRPPACLSASSGGSSSSSPDGAVTNQQQQSYDELVSGGSHQPPEESFGFTQAHISDYVKPNFYTIRLNLDPNKRKFSGQLMVKVELGAPASAQQQTTSGGSSSSSSYGVRYLTLHTGNNIGIKKAFYVFSGRSSIQIPATKIGRNLDQELLTLDFHPNSIPVPSQGLLLIVYNGLVNQTDSHGLFVHRNQAQAVSNGTTTSGWPTETTAAGLATHMEPCFARRLFPSWDEPHLKARFSLIVVLPFRGYEVISNMPVKRKSFSLSCSGEPLQEVEFNHTPVMSTYLLTLVVGRLEYIESITPNNCKIRVYFYANQTSNVSPAGYKSPPPLEGEHQIPQPQDQQVQNQRKFAAQMALEFAVKTFDYLERVLGVKYPLTKFDMIALRDFHSGAMENWGASIFHENYLLCDNSSSNANIRVNGGSNRPRRLVVPLVVAHEIVHQWFGNLLTSRTWTYLWLNEGFAQLLMFEVAQAVFPAENYWHIFVEDNRKSAMLEDELITSSRALELADAQLLSQEDQLSLFDQLTYNKGALLLRMVQYALGPREFTAGLKTYLWKHSYGSVISHDLWRALEESSTSQLQDKQLETVMSAWLSQEGFPLISVRVTSSPEQPNYRLELRQERFTLLPAEASGWRQSESSGKAEQTTSTTTNSSSNQPTVDQPRPWSKWLWSIPLTVASELRPQPSDQDLRLWPAHSGASEARQEARGDSSPATLLFSDKTSVVMLPKASVGDWFKLNYKAIGYFRVDYETVGDGVVSASGQQQQSIDMLARMAPAIRAAQLDPIDRYNIIEDLFACVLAGRKSVVYYLRFLQAAYDQESEPLVLRFIFESLERVKLAIVSNTRPPSGSPSSSSSSWARNLNTNEPPGNQLERSFDRYVQRFVRKLIGAFKMRQQQQQQQATTGPMTHHHHHRLRSLSNRTAESGANGQSADHSSTQLGASFLSLSWQQQRQKRRPPPPRLNERQKRGGNNNSNSNNNSGNNNNSAGELLELLDSIRLTYSGGQLGDTGNPQELPVLSNNNNTEDGASDDGEEGEPSIWAAQLFARHFRHNSQLPAAQTAQKSPLDLMGRELRASIYSAALNHKQQRPKPKQHQSGLNGADQGPELLHAGPTLLTGRPVPMPAVPKTQGPSDPVIRDNEAPRPLPGSTNELRDYVTSTTNNLELMRQQMRAAATMTTANGQTLDTLPASAAGGARAHHSHEDIVFARLLHAYESHHRTHTQGLERAAIAQALGSTRNLTKQIYLLNLTLSQGFFRAQDTGPMLDSLGHTRLGRQLIWLQLNEQTKLFKQRQLLSTALKSVSRGLIEQEREQHSYYSTLSSSSTTSFDTDQEPPLLSASSPTPQNTGKQQEQSVETQLRQLYAGHGNGEHGKLIGQSIEWIRINTLWFKRDHDSLAEFLLAESKTTEPTETTPTTATTTTTPAATTTTTTTTTAAASIITTTTIASANII
uniref:Puromycin-sensitive aminopeptidase n=1 Tax=Aceria tosichella TaxID=561515 RepID=A0A6G1SJ60_9ACAR